MGDDRRPVKTLCNGVFDLTHAGHYNALLQARQLGTELTVGVCKDEDTARAKGVVPIFNSQERAEMIRACRWVDRVIENAPYNVDLAYFKSTGCDFAAHGDDVAVNTDGRDVYSEFRALGFFREFKRTHGVSSSLLISGLLEEVNRSYGARSRKVVPGTFSTAIEDFEGVSSDIFAAFLLARHAEKGVSSRAISVGQSKTVYLSGSFDLLHTGHTSLFRRAKMVTGCDRLVVGVWTDSTVEAAKSEDVRRPLQPLIHRALNLLAMREIDEVLIGAARMPAPELLQRHNVCAVLFGNTKRGRVERDRLAKSLVGGTVSPDLICAPCEGLTTEKIFERIAANKELFTACLPKRLQGEAGTVAQAARMNLSPSACTAVVDGQLSDAAAETLQQLVSS